jgi:hypothetical protein
MKHIHSPPVLASNAAHLAELLNGSGYPGRKPDK